MPIAAPCPPDQSPRLDLFEIVLTLSHGEHLGLTTDLARLRKQWSAATITETIIEAVRREAERSALAP